MAFQPQDTLESYHTPTPHAKVQAGKADGKEAKAFMLEVSDFAVGRGELVCVIGAVGSGKTSLLSAILGEMEPAQYGGDAKSGGTPRVFKRPVRPSLVAQRPWIQNRSVKESILFGRPMDTRRYEEVRCQAWVGACVSN